MSQNPFKQLDSAYQASLRNAYKSAGVRQPGRAMLPEGRYQCIVSAFSLKENRNYPDELSLILGFEVLHGDQKGVTVYKFYNINPESLDILKTDLTIMNVDIEEDITLLGEMKTADKIIDQIVDITVKHKRKKDEQGYYQNIFLNRCLGKSSDYLQEVEDDELPFE